ncbi:MAG: hypothetical protein J6J71_01340 [Prevotella sp.]|nr:hypothetical protein [Prevotella sp.]
MAEWKIDITQAVKDTAKRALDEYQYKGHTIRQWADKITNGEFRPVRRSRWEVMADGYSLRCADPKCGYILVGRSTIRYCPNCGAQMTEEAWE